MQNNHGSTEIPESIKKLIKVVIFLKNGNRLFVYIFIYLFYLVMYLNLLGLVYQIFGYVGVESIQDSRSGTIG